MKFGLTLTSLVTIFYFTIAAPHLTENKSLDSLKDSIIRKKLLLATFPVQKASSIDVREIDFKPLQQTGRHLHPVQVTGYVVTGSVLFQIEGQSSKIIKAGEAFYEPAGKVIVHFDNPSKTKPLKFIAFYTLDGGTELIKMLPEDPLNK